jgi:hypothetical protein
MHVRHEALFRWLERTFPGGRLYGPYHHDGRDYYQWMARGAFLREVLLPLVEERLSTDLDEHAYRRFVEMRDRYAAQLHPRLGPTDEPTFDARAPSEEGF